MDFDHRIDFALWVKVNLDDIKTALFALFGVCGEIASCGTENMLLLFAVNCRGGLCKNRLAIGIKSSCFDLDKDEIFLVFDNEIDFATKRSKVFVYNAITAFFELFCGGVFSKIASDSS